VRGDVAVAVPCKSSVSSKIVLARRNEDARAKKSAGDFLDNFVVSPRLLLKYQLFQPFLLGQAAAGTSSLEGGGSAAATSATLAQPGVAAQSACVEPAPSRDFAPAPSLNVRLASASSRRTASASSRIRVKILGL
jgi:hypothetical protein